MGTRNPDIALGLKDLSLISPPGAIFTLSYRWGFGAQGTEGDQEASQLGG